MKVKKNLLISRAAAAAGVALAKATGKSGLSAVVEAQLLAGRREAASEHYSEVVLAPLPFNDTRRRYLEDKHK
jgi:hypothetical protein